MTANLSNCMGTSCEFVKILLSQLRAKDKQISQLIEKQSYSNYYYNQEVSITTNGNKSVKGDLNQVSNSISIK